MSGSLLSSWVSKDTSSKLGSNLEKTWESSLQETLLQKTISYRDLNANSFDFSDLSEEKGDHSINRLKDFFNHPNLWWVLISLNAKQESQLWSDFDKLFFDKKVLYMSLNSHNDSLSSISSYNLPFGVDSTIDSLVKLLTFKSCPDCTQTKLIIDKLFELSKKLFKWKETTDKLKLKWDEYVLFNYLKQNNINVVVNIFNIIEWINHLWNFKGEYSWKLNNAVKFFEETPFKLIVSEFLPKQDKDDSSPKSWSDFENITLSLPLPWDYKNMMDGVIKWSSLEASYQEFSQNNPDLIQKIFKSCQWLYLRYFKKYIILYVQSNTIFNYESFLEWLDHFKVESINSMNNWALEIMNYSHDFNSIWWLDAIKNEFFSIWESLSEWNDKQIIKSYLLAWLPWTWKSYIAKALPTQLTQHTWNKWIGVRLNVWALFDMYVWNTEKNFAQACKIIDGIIRSNDGRLVVWIDEVEKSLGSNGHTNSVDWKLMGELLNVLEEKWIREIVIVATVNDVLKLSAELKWRFPNAFFFDTPWLDARTSVIKIKVKDFWFCFTDSEIAKIVELTDKFVPRELDNLFSNIKKRIVTIKNWLLKKWVITKDKYDFITTPSISIVEEIIERYSTNIQEISSSAQITEIRQRCKDFSPAEGIVSDSGSIEVSIDDIHPWCQISDDKEIIQ